MSATSTRTEKGCHLAAFFCAPNDAVPTGIVLKPDGFMTGQHGFVARNDRIVGDGLKIRITPPCQMEFY